MYSQNTTTSQEMFAAADGIRNRASALEADQQQFSGSLASMVGLDFDGAAAQSGISRAREIIESITAATRVMRIVADACRLVSAILCHRLSAACPPTAR